MSKKPKNKYEKPLLSMTLDELNAAFDEIEAKLKESLEDRLPN